MHMCCCGRPRLQSRFFFFNDTATTEIYTLSLHDALPIYVELRQLLHAVGAEVLIPEATGDLEVALEAGDHEQLLEDLRRSEEHTSELQSQSNLVCRLLLEKKKRETQLRRETQQKQRPPRT